MRLTKHIGDELSLPKPKENREEEFPPKVTTSLLGGIVILFLFFLGILLLTVAAERSEYGSVIKLFFTLSVALGLIAVTAYMLCLVIGKVIANFINHYDDGNGD